LGLVDPDAVFTLMPFAAVLGIELDGAAQRVAQVTQAQAVLRPSA
jgi:hypothetical protein